MRAPIPNKYSEAKVSLILAKLREGASQKAAANYAGVTQQTLHYWRRRDAEIDAAVLESIRASRRDRDRALHASA